MESITITETRAKVSLDALMRHKAERICEMQRDSLLKYLHDKDEDIVELVLLSSWGMDGSTGHSQYHQILPNGKSDSDLFATALTPIRLSLYNDDKTTFWLNLTPQSVRFCSPISIEFIKESKEVVMRTKEEVEKEIAQLEYHRVDLTPNCSDKDRKKYALICFCFILSMIDGKVLSFITDNSSMQRCPLCGTGPKDMNDKALFEEGFLAKEECLDFGIQPLHAWMRFLEHLLHISYRMQLKVWRVLAMHREIYKKTKADVQEKLRKAFNVNVDQPRAGGAGTSNTGNVCRRLFADPQKLSEALGINQELIERYRNILIAVNCQQPLNPEKLGQYCKDTYKLYLELYPWYKIPASVHKILAHIGEVIMHSPAPLGSLGEEGAESNNKIYKENRRYHARKCSREANLQDTFVRSLHLSDVIISTHTLSQRLAKKKSIGLPNVVKEFLILPDQEIENLGDPSLVYDEMEEIMVDLENCNANFEDDAEMD
jgi:hypothetical protein